MFLKAFILIIVVYYLVKWMARIVLPHVVKQQMDKFQDQFNQQNAYQQQERRRKEGSVTVENVKSKGSSRKDEGEYVDFEEIK